jgi:hypothetical protein
LSGELRLLSLRGIDSQGMLTMYDLEGVHLEEYKNLRKDWTDWNVVRQSCMNLALSIFDFMAE